MAGDVDNDEGFGLVLGVNFRSGLFDPGLFFELWSMLVFLVGEVVFRICSGSVLLSFLLGVSSKNFERRLISEDDGSTLGSLATLRLVDTETSATTELADRIALLFGSVWRDTIGDLDVCGAST